MEDSYCKLQQAVFERFQSVPKTSWSKLAAKHGHPATTIRRAYTQWMSHPPESQPEMPFDVHIAMRAPGRPCMFHEKEEKLIAEAIKEFFNRKTPLSPSCVQDVVQDYVRMLPKFRRDQIKFVEDRPSINWIHSFNEGHELAVKPVRIIDDKRVQAMTREHIVEHICRVKAAMKRFNINDPRFLFKMDQSGCSFMKMTECSIRKAVGPRKTPLIHSGIKLKGNIERVTVMPTVSASSVAYKPVIVFPGVERHFSHVKGLVQTLHDVLSPCYLYQREVPGVNTETILS